ncbi:hypothetical protein YC2023_041328 [Brassica napus]
MDFYYIDIRYKLQVKVADHTGSTSFLLFDREVIQLIHKSAYELLEQQVQFNRENEIPQELMDLEGRKIVCVIRVKGTEKNFKQPSFNVVKLSDTPDVIHNFQDNMRMEFKSESDYREVTVNGIGDSFLRSLVLTTLQTDHEAVECFKGRLAFLENISCADVARNIGCGGLR